jgi:hypothetical protein
MRSWLERCDYTEVPRLKGWMLFLNGNSKGAEQNCSRVARLACEQRAKSWELRTATARDAVEIAA